MTKPDLPIEAHLLAALKREMQRPADESVQRAVTARLGAALGPSLGVPHLSGIDSASGAVGSAKVAASAAATGVSWVHPVAIFLASATLGTGALLGVEAIVERPRPAAPLVSRAAEAPLPLARAAVPPSLERVTPASEPAPARSAARAPNPKPGAAMSSSSSPASEPSLREQQALLDTARRELARHDGAAALEALAQHRARFPKTALEEEREALTVKALRESGRAAEASARARRFSEDYPRSVFLPGVSPSPEPIP